MIFCLEKLTEGIFRLCKIRPPKLVQHGSRDRKQNYSVLSSLKNFAFVPHWFWRRGDNGVFKTEVKKKIETHILCVYICILTHRHTQKSGNYGHLDSEQKGFVRRFLG